MAKSTLSKDGAAERRQTTSTSNPRDGSQSNNGDNSSSSFVSGNSKPSSSTGGGHCALPTGDMSLAQRVEEQRLAQQRQDLLSQLSEGIVGLQNYSYYCYMNSCLQCLLAVEQLKDHFITLAYKEKFPHSKPARVRHTFKLSLAFTRFYQDVWLKKNNQAHTYKRDRKGRSS